MLLLSVRKREVYEQFCKEYVSQDSTSVVIAMWGWEIHCPKQSGECTEGLERQIETVDEWLDG